jgi:hypothetical protein
VSLPLEQRVSNSGAAVRDGDMPVLTDQEGQFARNYNRRHFLFRHGLKDHPLFELPSLVDLARRPFHHEPYWSNGKVNANDPWGINRDARLSLIETIANIGDNNSLVILKQVAQDPVYGPVLQELLARVVALSGEQMRQEVMVGETTILISSPNRLTSYHMDDDCNFLMQAVGNKTLWVYDHTDLTLVSHEEREHITWVTLIALFSRKTGNARLPLMSCTPDMACTSPFSRRIGCAITTTSPLP